MDRVIAGYGSKAEADAVADEYRQDGCSPVEVTPEGGGWTVRAANCPAFSDEELVRKPTRKEAEDRKNRFLQDGYARAWIEPRDDGTWSVRARGAPA